MVIVVCVFVRVNLPIIAQDLLKVQTLIVPLDLSYAVVFDAMTEGTEFLFKTIMCFVRFRLIGVECVFCPKETVCPLFTKHGFLAHSFHVCHLVEDICCGNFSLFFMLDCLFQDERSGLMYP